MKTLRQIQGFALLYLIYWGFFSYITILSSLCGTPAPRTMSWEDFYALWYINENRATTYVECSCNTGVGSGPQFISRGKRSLKRHSIFHLKWCFLSRSTSICLSLLVTYLCYFLFTDPGGNSGGLCTWYVQKNIPYIIGEISSSDSTFPCVVIKGKSFSSLDWEPFTSLSLEIGIGIYLIEQLASCFPGKR